MTSKTSLLNGGIFKYNIKRFSWLSALYAFFLFLAVPYSLLVNKKYYLSDIFENPDRLSRYLLTNIPAFILLIGAAVLLAVSVFRYMQKTRSATLFHALPVTRTQLYLTNLLSGFVLLLAPILLNAVILGVMSLLGGYAQVLPLSLIGDWVLFQAIAGFATLAFTMFVGVFTGSSVAQVLFVFILSFLPLAGTAIMALYLDGWLFGFTETTMNDTYNFLLKLVPMFYPQFLGLEEMRVWWIPFLQLFYILFFTGLGLFFYHKRDTERAGDIVAFSWVKPIFLYGVTFCTMLFGGTVFGLVEGDLVSITLSWLLFALLGYAVAKILLLKSFRIFKYYKGYLVCAVIILLSIFAIDANIFGFGTRVPDFNKVEKAYVGSYYYSDSAFEEDNNYLYRNHSDYVVLTGREEIAMAMDFHQNMIDKSAKIPSGRYNGESYAVIAGGYRVVAYQLESGRIIVRKYWCPEELESEYNAIFSTESAKDYRYPILRKHPEIITAIGLREAAVYGEQKDALVAALRKDLAALSYEQTMEASYHLEVTIPRAAAENVAQVILSDSEINVDVSRSIQFSFNDNFKETIQWLWDNGYQPYGQTLTVVN